MDEPLSLDRLQDLASTAPAPAPVAVDPVEKGAALPPSPAGEQKAPAKNGVDAKDSKADNNKPNADEKGEAEKSSPAAPANAQGQRPLNGIATVLSLIGATFNFLQDNLLKLFWPSKK